jgi:hypothetical protein
MGANNLEVGPVQTDSRNSWLSTIRIIRVMVAHIQVNGRATINGYSFVAV